jgi:vancomycin resistance protein YoaR
MSQSSRRAFWVAAAVLGLSGAVLVGIYFFQMRQARAQVGSPAVAGAPAVAVDDGKVDALAPRVKAAAEAALERKVTLAFDGKVVSATWKELAFVVDDETVRTVAARLARDGAGEVTADSLVAGHYTVPVVMDRKAGVEALLAYKDRYDRAPVDARVNLEKRTVSEEQPGFGIDLYASVARLEQAARAGDSQVELVASPIPATVTRAQLGNLDVSHVMGWFETRYPMVEKDRNYNLKVAAEKLNGHVLMPGEEFSFNEVVGDRTENEGYRVAHVIQAGEMIDGLAGGTCQISSTLHGAAFFAGLTIVKSRPHSRPSAYITMGMDATVVYPSTDMKLRNDYDFPVVIHYVVAQGVVRVEILGKQRPYDKVTFERVVKEEIPFETITREDDTLPIGAKIVEQPGFPGYNLERYRKFWKDGKELTEKREKWVIKYPTTTEYLRIGTSPDPNLVAPSQGKLHGPMDPKGKTYTMSQ